MNNTNPSNCVRSSRAVFIIGMNGSGTTMMLDHLAAHPNLFGFGLESYILPIYLKKERAYGDLTVDRNFLRLWDDMRSEYVFKIANRGVTPNRPEEWRKVPRSVAGVFDKILKQFAAREGKERWCEKTPMHVFHMQTLAEVFPDAKFIHMIRDGRDCAVSCYRRWKTHPVGAAFRWQEATRTGRTVGLTLRSRYKEVRYEDITTRPVHVLRGVCDFLDEDFSEKILETKRVRPAITGNNSSSIVRNPSDRGILERSGRLEEIERLIGKSLTEFGYDAKYPESEATPGSLSRFRWTANDAFFYVKRMIIGKVIGRPRQSWSMLFSRVVTVAKSKLIR
jgi:hypothetical protein